MFNELTSIPFDAKVWVLALFAWSLVWKGLALWRAAQRGSKPWFVAFLVVNTVGILEILYLYVFSQPRGERQKAE
jgi:hypothetical protein